MLRKFLIVFPPVEKKERSVPSKKEKKKVRGLTDTGRKRVPRRTEVGKTGPPPSFFLLFEAPFIPPPPAHEGAGERRPNHSSLSLSLSLSVRSVRETAFHLSNGQDLFFIGPET